jgi:Ice-binding-like
MPRNRAARQRARIWRRRRVSASLAPLAVIVSVAMLIPIIRGDAATLLSLGSAESFAVLAGTAITNTGTTTIVGDVGSSPTSAITGFGTVALTGTNHGGDATTVQAKTDLDAAYVKAVGSAPTATIGTELGGTTVTPGVYNSAAGTFAITGTLTLDSQSDPNAVFIFQMATTLTTAAASAVTFSNGGSACNVFWQVGSSATLGANTQLLGSILAFTSITSGAGSNIAGRLLAEGGAVTIDSNNITVPACTPPPPPTTTATEPPTTTTTVPTTTRRPSHRPRQRPCLRRPRRPRPHRQPQAARLTPPPRPAPRCQLPRRQLIPRRAPPASEARRPPRQRRRQRTRRRQLLRQRRLSQRRLTPLAWP